MASNSEDPQMFSSTVLYSEDLIPMIYQYLPFKDRKSSLRINRSWYRSCILQFRKQSLVEFNSINDVDSFMEVEHEEPQTEFRFQEPINLSVWTSNNDSIVIDVFLKKFASIIKTFDGYFFLYEFHNYERMFHILNQLENVQELRLRIRQSGSEDSPAAVPYSGNGNDQEQLEQTQLSSLKKLIISFTSESARGVLDFLPSLLNMTTSIKSLDIRPWSPKPHPNDVQLTDTIIKLLTHGLESQSMVSNFQNLTELAIIVPKPELLQCLAHLPRSLERLEFFSKWYQCLTSERRGATIMKNVLPSHAATLMSLKMPINIVEFIDGADSLNFPLLPQLVELELEFLSQRGFFDARIPPDGVPFPRSRINYPSIMPKLEILKIDARNNDGSRAFLDDINHVFIPDEESRIVSKSLKQITILHPFENNEDKEQLENFIHGRIKRAFPNVLQPRFLQ